MTDGKKRWKLTASAKLPAGTFVNLSAAGVGNHGKVKDPVTGKMVDGIEYCGRLDGGHEVEVDVIEMPERLQGAVNRGDLTIVSGAK